MDAYLEKQKRLEQEFKQLEDKLEQEIMNELEEKKQHFQYLEFLCNEEYLEKHDKLNEEMRQTREDLQTHGLDDKEYTTQLNDLVEFFDEQVRLLEQCHHTKKAKIEQQLAEEISEIEKKFLKLQDTIERDFMQKQFDDIE